MLVQKELKNAYIWIPFPESIVLDKSSISLTTIWQTEQLTATIEPTISDHSITWSSDDTTVATVSTTGLVTCVTPWTCTITATTVNRLTATCSVEQWWQPWANTIAYYPLTSTATVNDMSGNNRNLTNKWLTFWTYDWVDCAYASWSSYAYITSNPITWNSLFTASIWCKMSNTSWWKNSIAFWNYWNNVSFSIWVNGTSLYTGWWNNDRDTGYTMSTNTRTHTVVTHDNWTIKVYVNGTLQYTSTVSFSLSSTKTVIGAWLLNYWDKWSGYLSDAIEETVVWTAQEVSDYYNQTKSNYGL